MQRIISDIIVRYGADPEGFFEQGGRIIGSERVVPEEGFIWPEGNVVRDGVQFELHPTPKMHMAPLSRIESLLTRLGEKATALGYTISKQRVAMIDEVELESLSQKSRELGCQPSLNIYTGRSVIAAPYGYPIRSAGGHMHFDLIETPLYDSNSDRDERRNLVRLLDITVGAVSTAFDTDSDQALRRELYGKAGEFRLPSYGLEYRTPSNVWVNNKFLATLLFGLANFSIRLLTTTLVSPFTGLAEEFVDRFDLAQLREVINTNNVGAAKQHMTSLREVIKDYDDGVDALFDQQVETKSKRPRFEDLYKQDLWTSRIVLEDIGR